MKKKIVSDTVFSIIAEALPLLMLQLVIYPIIAKVLSGTDYGIMITLFSAIQLVSGTFGVSLNNIRIIKNNMYTERSVTGDFNLLMFFNSVIVLLLVGISYFLYSTRITVMGLLLILFTGFFCVMCSYYEAGFRLSLDFKGILMLSVLSTLGYLCGLLLFFIFDKWEFVFLLSYLFRFIFIIIKTDLIKEPFVVTELFKDTLKDSLYMYFSSFCTRMITYADKLILLPLIGGAQVSIYYTATVVAKVISLAMNPINSVILSYLGKVKHISAKSIRTYIFVAAIACLICYFLAMIVTRPVIELLFPQWVDMTMQYIPITTFNVCVLAFCNILTPLTLKYCDMRWQLVLNSTTLLIYSVLSLVMFKFCGLFGFCIGIGCSYIIKAILILLVYCRYNNISFDVMERS